MAWARAWAWAVAVGARKRLADRSQVEINAAPVARDTPVARNRDSVRLGRQSRLCD